MHYYIYMYYVLKAEFKLSSLIIIMTTFLSGVKGHIHELELAIVG